MDRICAVPRRNPDLPAAMARLQALADNQAGAFTTGQARGAGVDEHVIARMIRRGSWQRMHRGVHLASPLPPTLQSRMWAAHLALGPRSVVGGRAAARYWGLLDEGLEPEPLEILLPDGSTRRAAGLEVRRVPEPEALAHPARVPPVLGVEHAVLDRVARERDDAHAVEVVLRACRLRLTTPERLLAAATGRPRLARRALLHALCGEIRLGATSHLERRYLLRVERGHGLPRGLRQVAFPRLGAATAYRDVEYAGYGVLVELDGRLGHESESDQFRDLGRDNVAALTGRATLRYGWLAVEGTPCDVAGQVSDLLQLRGWDGRARPCGRGCALADAGPGAGGRRAPA